jgi:hypothetical protein
MVADGTGAGGERATPLVSVIVPAWNAAATIEETLRSAAAQTWRNLEILIVDDGSTDPTPDIARRFCSVEPRARLLSKPNGGVASARNLGLAEARGAWVAPLDADDLWHPEKIALQMEAALAAPGPIAFVYCWFRHIDVEGRVWRDGPALRVEGRAFRRLAFRNAVGNGSAPLIPRAAALAAGGYDPRLRERGCEGGEDYVLQLRLARDAPVLLVPLYLVGYRFAGGTMSGDPSRAFAARTAAFDLVEREGLGLPRRLGRRREAALRLQLAEAAAVRRRPVAAASNLGGALARDPSRTLVWLGCRAARALLARVRPALPIPPRFLDCDPACPSGTDPAAAAMRPVEAFDARRLARLDRD